MNVSTNANLERNIFKEMTFNLRENLILAVIIIVMSLGAGLAFSKLYKPNYVATEDVNYVAYHTSYEEDVTMSIDIMEEYVDTMVDFCTTGIVFDRAEYYYIQYLNSNKDIDSFVNEIKSGEHDAGYYPQNVQERKYFDENNFTANLVMKSLTQPSFIFRLTCTDSDMQVSKEKIRIFSVAIDRQARDYFDGVKTYVSELVKDVEGVSAVADGSTFRTLFIFGLIGLAIAFGLIYVKTYYDNTIKSKEEMKGLTGLDVIAYVTKQEDSDERK